jgi:hypothetical protein
MACLATAAVAHAERGHDDGLTAARARAAGAAKGFTMSGRVAGLVPGQSRALVVTVANRHRFPIAVRSIAARITTNRRGCAPRNLIARGFRGRKRIPPRRRTRVRLRVSLRLTAPDACQGVAFRLGFRGRAVRG